MVMPKQSLCDTNNDSRGDDGNAPSQLIMQDSERSLLQDHTDGHQTIIADDGKGIDKSDTTDLTTQCTRENLQQSCNNTDNDRQTCDTPTDVCTTLNLTKQDPKNNLQYNLGNHNTSAGNDHDIDNVNKVDFNEKPSSAQDSGESSQSQNRTDSDENAQNVGGLKTSITNEQAKKRNISVGDVFTLTLRPIKRENNDSQQHDTDSQSTSESDFKTLKVQIVEEKCDYDSDDGQHEDWICSVDSDEESPQDARNRAITKKEKHRYAAARYRHKEIVLKEQLQKDEKKLSDENIQLQARIQTLSSVRTACIAHLKSISTQKLCEGVSSLAALIPPGHEEALVSVKVVLYREIANQIKELAHIYKTPVKDPVVPEPQKQTVLQKQTVESEEVSENSPIFALSRVTPSVFAIKEVNNSSENLGVTQNSPVKVQDISGPISNNSLTPERALCHDSAVAVLPKSIPVEEEYESTQSSVGLPHTEEMSVATSTNIIPPPTTPTSHLQAGNMTAGHVSTSEDLIYTESKSTSDMNPVSMEVVRIPAQILLPMPILEQAAPIDLSKKKQTICSEYEQMGIEEQTTESCEQTTESSALPEICTNSLESGSRCDELNLLATTALSMGLTNRDASNQVGDVTRQKLPFEVSSEIATAKDYSRSKLLRHEPPSSDIEMVHYRDADDESSCEAPASVPPQSDPMDLSKVATDKQNEQPTPAWRNLSPTGPVVVWVQSMSTGIGELPRRTDHSRIRTDANDVTYGSSSQSSTQPSAQSCTQSTVQPGIHLITTPHSHEASFAQQHQHLPGSSREDFVQSPERFHSPSSAAYQIPSDSISLSSSEDGEASTSGYYHGVESMTGVPQGSIPGSPMPGQVKLLHKNFRSPQKGTPLIGDTRRERQRHASKKNRVKNQMMRKALLQDEKHLISSNTKLQGTIRQLESIKSACLGMLATTNLHLTTQLTMHTAKQPVLKPYWDSLGVTIALRVPDPLDMDTNAINIEGALPFKELRCDSKTWPEPMNPHFMSQVLMNVKVDGLEWNGSLLSKGEVTIVTEKGAKTDDDAMLAVDSVVVKKEVTMATEKDDETEDDMLVIDTGSGKEVTMDTV